jgi:hypothetical protein
MRNVTPVETPNLFSPDLMSEAPAVEEQRLESEPLRMAREFVRWCWSFGSDFRNSPDITNLRFWQQKTGASWPRQEDDEVLAEARRLFMKKLEQAVRKADVPKTTD